MKMVRILEVKPMDGQCVQLTFIERSVIERDLGPMLQGTVFLEVRSREARFCEMHLEEDSPVRPNGADLCPDSVIWGGLPLAGHGA